MGRFCYMLQNANEVAKRAASIVTSASGSNASLPSGNAVILPVAHPWRSDTTLAIPWLEIDMGGAVTADTVAVVGHNVTKDALGWRIKSGNATPPTTTTWDLSHDERRRKRTDWATVAAASPVSHRYWRIEIDDTNNPDGYIEIGYVVIGVRSRFSGHFLNGWTERHERTNRRAQTSLGVPLVGEKVADLRNLALEFDALSEVQWREVEDLLEIVDGSRLPFLFAPDEDDDRVGFGRLLDASYEVARISRGFGSIPSVTLGEDSFGVSLTTN